VTPGGDSFKAKVLEERKRRRSDRRRHAGEPRDVAEGWGADDVSSEEEDKAEGWTWKGGDGGVEDEATICKRRPRE
jgi:hypothetical protein